MTYRRVGGLVDTTAQVFVLAEAAPGARVFIEPAWIGPPTPLAVWELVIVGNESTDNPQSEV